MRKKFLLFSFALIILILVSCGKDNDSKSHKEHLVIATIEENSFYLNKVVEEYNNKSNDYYIEVEEYRTIEEIKYKLFYKTIAPDFIVFNNFNDANHMFKDLLQPLNKCEFVGNYQSAIINYLLNDKELYVIPSLGFMYTSCYNIDLLKANNIETPTTINELLLTSLRMKRTGINPTVSLGGDEFILSSLMEVAIPMYLSTTKGINFLNDYYLGSTTINDNQDAYNALENIFKTYIALFRNGYFSIDNYNYTEDDAVKEFVNKKEAYSIINTPNIKVSNPLLEAEEKFEYSNYPFVGNTQMQDYIGSKPLLYLGTTKQSFKNNSKKEGILDFYNFFSSKDGEEAFKDVTNINSNKSTIFISYIKNENLLFDKTNLPLKDAITHGRNFLVDSYVTVFEHFTNIIYDYIYQNVNGTGEDFSSLIKKIDNENSNIINQKKMVYKIECDFDFDASNRLKETRLGNLTADAICSQTGVDITLISSSFIQSNIYKGDFLDDYFNVVYQKTKGCKVKIKGSTVKKIINDNILNKDLTPLISGVRINNVNNELKVYLMNKSSIVDDKIYSCFISQDYYDLYNELIISSYTSNDLQNYIKQYFNTYNFECSLIDNRYGNVFIGDDNNEEI